MRYNKDFEKSYLASKSTSPISTNVKRHRRVIGAQRRAEIVKLAMLQTNAEFFNCILDNETERELWLIFMTGKMVKKDAYGKPVLDEQGQPIMEDVELNPISYKAFQRAVEYKRGMPAVTVETKKADSQKVIEIVTIGATPEFFEDQARSIGLLRAANGDNR